MESAQGFYCAGQRAVPLQYEILDGKSMSGWGDVFLGHSNAALGSHRGLFWFLPVHALHMGLIEFGVLSQTAEFR